MIKRQRATWMLVLVLNATLLVRSPANGQASTATARPAYHAQGQAALEQLRDGEVAKALAALGPATDTLTIWHPTEDDGLSAAAGGLYRALVQLDAGEQYDLLYKWSMPTDVRKSVRLLTAMVPQDAPPEVFARALGERPRDTSFAVAEINGIRGLFSTGWSLVQAADDLGRLRRLIGELEPLAAERVPNADVLLLLARTADARGDLTELTEQLEQRAAALRKSTEAANAQAAGIDPAHVLLAAAGLKHESLRPLCEDIFEALIEQTYGGTATGVRPFLRVAHATAIQLNRGESGPDVLRRNRLKYWVPVSGKTSELNVRGAVEAMWLVHEDHILHLAGARSSMLFCRFPLTGDFDFTCETQEGGRIATDGGLVYGGLQFEALGRTNQLTVWDADTAHYVQKPCPFVRHEDRPTFNRVSIRSNAEGAQFAANLHPVWFDDATSQRSPWLGLRSFNERRPIFRNLKITGKPVIPREVRLSDGDQLRGWQSHFFGERQPPFAVTTIDEGTRSVVPDFDWSLNAGVMQALKRELAEGVNPQSLLRYQRPLLDGESIAYEFHYEPGAFEVHPALGRLAFLIEPAGVRIHWITDGQREWTGLPMENATLEPLNRRGPRPLPLKENGWNRLTLARADGKVTVSLNGELIYQRPVDFGGDHTFGLYRDRTKTAVKVRNVVMTGDWPETLPKDFLENPVTVIEEPQAGIDRQPLNETIGEEFVAENVGQVRRNAAHLPPAERFEYLCRWVLPSRKHADFRVVGDFTQTDPSPFALRLEHIGADSESVESPSSSRGAELVSPVFDLLDVATGTGKLNELRDRIAAVPQPDDEWNRRAQAALLTLVNLELNDAEAAEQPFETLHSLANQAEPAGLRGQWPETLVVYRGMQRFADNPAVGDLLELLFAQRVGASPWYPGGIENWHTQIASLMGRRHQNQVAKSQASSDAIDRLANWVPVVRSRAKSRGTGCAHARWTTGGNEVHHRSGHQEEYVFYRSPLRGNFEVECDIWALGTTQVLAAGRFDAPENGGRKLEFGTFRRGAFERPPVDPPFSKLDAWVRYRAVFRDGTCAVYLNGRLVRTEQLPEHSDPWIGVRSWWKHAARFRDVRITGNPQVPEEVVLSASPDLIGWLQYYDEAVGYGSLDWNFVSDRDAGGQIVGRRRDEIRRSYLESLLRYHRPLLEDGSIEYEFFYEPGDVHTHPALDRLAFLVDAGGVKVHWLTDGPYDPTGVRPDNMLVETENRRGPAALPLKPGQWNDMKLSVTGSTARLELNGQLVYERVLEATNRRTFGLFHFADQTEVRVRNIVMRGDWPKSVPPVDKQQLADQLVVSLDADLPKFKSVFAHDFAKDGLPAEYVKPTDSDSGGRLLLRPDGVSIIRPAAAKWTASQLILPFILQGDFDVEARFDRLQLESDGYACIMLDAHFDDEMQQQCRVIRTLTRKEFHQVHATVSLLHPDGTRSYPARAHVACEAISGRLRLARRGDTVHYLFAENDSTEFRLVGSETISDKPTNSDGIGLRALCSGTGETQVVWKNVRLAAEELLILPDSSAKPKSVLFVMNADGTNVRTITADVPGEHSHGSPDWSPDGKQIAFDIWSGRSDTSHVFLVNSDGTGAKDLGIGAMPTFSPDGKRLAFTWGGHGMAIMDKDGTNREVVTAEGWGAQWSPDGRWIAYESRHRTDRDFSANITIIDVNTKETRLLLEGEQATRYSQVYWNMEWSPDSRQIVFKGDVKNAETEAALTSVAGSSKGFRVLTTEEVVADFSWHPDGRSILLSMNSKEYAGSRLFVCDLKMGKIDLLDAQPMDQVSTSGVWSPDGKRIVFVSRRKPQPIPWQEYLAKKDE